MNGDMIFWLVAAAGAGSVIGFMTCALVCGMEIRKVRDQALRANKDGFAEAMRYMANKKTQRLEEERGMA